MDSYFFFKLLIDSLHMFTALTRPRMSFAILETVKRRGTKSKNKFLIWKDMSEMKQLNLLMVHNFYLI
jgi:hypothetical protein